MLRVAQGFVCAMQALYQSPRPSPRFSLCECFRECAGIDVGGLCPPPSATASLTDGTWSSPFSARLAGHEGPEVPPSLLRGLWGSNLGPHADLSPQLLGSFFPFHSQATDWGPTGTWVFRSQGGVSIWPAPRSEVPYLCMFTSTRLLWACSELCWSNGCSVLDPEADPLSS